MGIGGWEASVVSGFKPDRDPFRQAAIGMDGVSRCEPFRQTGKTALRLDPDGWSRRSGFIEHRCDQRL